eukprot:5006229-Pyramimonas_sp.AAC.1
MLSLTDATKAELEHRVAIGWREFWAMKRLLMNADTSLYRRLNLFDAAIGSSVLYGAGSWTPRADETRFLTTAENGMLRRICGIRRRLEEPWHEWIRRATSRARAKARAAGVRDWPTAHAARKWSWAGHVCRSSARTWAWRVTFWRDSAWTADARREGSGRLMRPSRRRHMKWEDKLRQYA